MRSERTPPARRYWAALSFLLVGTVLGIWHNREINRSRPDIVVGVTRGATAPAVGIFARASRWFSGQTAWFRDARTAAADNAQLKSQIAELRGDNARLREAQIDYERLRSDLGFLRSSPNKLLAADVIAFRADPKFDTLVLSRGSHDGVHINSVVRTRAGLVGHVFEVTPTTASVLLLTDLKSGVGARVQRAPSRATGVCEGDNSSQLSLKYLPFEADVKSGDLIVTSGLGGVYPAGLAIGTVAGVKADEGAVGKTAQIHPAVDFDRLEEVYVLP